MVKLLHRTDLVYPDLCYQIIGVLYDVHNSLGYGYKEKYYQRAVARGFELCGLSFLEQSPAVITFSGKKIGRVFFDFLIAEKVILEIKKTDRFSKTEIEQVYGYLKASGLKLGIIAHFTKGGVAFKRIVNISQ